MLGCYYLCYCDLCYLPMTVSYVVWIFMLLGMNSFITLILVELVSNKLIMANDYSTLSANITYEWHSVFSQRQMAYNQAMSIEYRPSGVWDGPLNCWIIQPLLHVEKGGGGRRRFLTFFVAKFYDLLRPNAAISDNSLMRCLGATKTLSNQFSASKHYELWGLKSSSHEPSSHRLLNSCWITPHVLGTRNSKDEETKRRRERERERERVRGMQARR